FQAEDGIRDFHVTGVQTCALPISPDDMARMQIGVKRATPEAIERWKVERGYDKPMFVNAEAEGSARFTDTIFFDKSLRMFALERSEERRVGKEGRWRGWADRVRRA